MDQGREIENIRDIGLRNEWEKIVKNIAPGMTIGSSKFKISFESDLYK